MDICQNSFQLIVDGSFQVIYSRKKVDLPPSQGHSNRNPSIMDIRQLRTNFLVPRVSIIEGFYCITLQYPSISSIKRRSLPNLALNVGDERRCLKYVSNTFTAWESCRVISSCFNVLYTSLTTVPYH